MSKKSSVPLRIAPLQCVVAEPITDPAEQAALDKLHRREKRKQRRQEARAASKDVKSTSRSAPRKRG